MISIVRTDSNNKDFVELVKFLDRFLKVADGDDHDFYNQYNNIDILKNVVVAYLDNKPLGCGAFKRYNNEAIEIKRMYVSPESRGLGVATKILNELEVWTKELGYKRCILETGIIMKKARKLYKTNGYRIIQNYGQYEGVEKSICFEKYI